MTLLSVTPRYPCDAIVLAVPFGLICHHETPDCRLPPTFIAVSRAVINVPLTYHAVSMRESLESRPPSFSGVYGSPSPRHCTCRQLASGTGPAFWFAVGGTP